MSQETDGLACRNSMEWSDTVGASSAAAHSIFTQALVIPAWLFLIWLESAGIRRGGWSTDTTVTVLVGVVLFCVVHIGCTVGAFRVQGNYHVGPNGVAFMPRFGRPRHIAWQDVKRVALRERNGSVEVYWLPLRSLRIDVTMMATEDWKANYVTLKRVILAYYNYDESRVGDWTPFAGTSIQRPGWLAACMMSIVMLGAAVFRVVGNWNHPFALTVVVAVSVYGAFALLFAYVCVEGRMTLRCTSCGTRTSLRHLFNARSHDVRVGRLRYSQARCMKCRTVIARADLPSRPANDGIRVMSADVVCPMSGHGGPSGRSVTWVTVERRVDRALGFCLWLLVAVTPLLGLWDQRARRALGISDAVFRYAGVLALAASVAWLLLCTYFVNRLVVRCRRCGTGTNVRRQYGVTYRGLRKGRYDDTEAKCRACGETLVHPVRFPRSAPLFEDERDQRVNV